MATHMSALSTLRVLDLTRGVTGPFCTKLMAGFGAEVVKVESPDGGDPLRSAGPFVGGIEGSDRSIPFHWYNTGKKSITLDLSRTAGADMCRRLVECADIVVDDFAPGVMTDRGLDYETLKTVRPDIVMTSITSFGQSGPYRDYQAEEITQYAMTGAMYATGDPARSPLAAGLPIVQLSAGMKAYIATLMGYFRRKQTGEGARIDVSVQEAGLDNLEIAIAEYLHLGKSNRRTNDEHSLVPWRTYPCRDGHAAIIGGPIRHWLSGASLFKEPELTGEKYDHMAKRIASRDRIRELMTPWLSANTKLDIFHAGQGRGLAFSYVASFDEVLRSPQHEARGFFVPTRCGEGGVRHMAGAPFRPSRTPWRQHPSPRLGQHTEAVLRDLLSLANDDVARLRHEGIV